MMVNNVNGWEYLWLIVINSGLMVIHGDEWWLLMANSELMMLPSGYVKIAIEWENDHSLIVDDDHTMLMMTIN